MLWRVAKAMALAQGWGCAIVVKTETKGGLTDRELR